MHAKLLLLLALSHSLVHAMMDCCEEKHNYILMRTCGDGSAPKIKDCETIYALQANDSDTSIDFDEADRLLIDMEDPIPTDEYCYTIDKATNEAVFLVCYTDQSDAVEEASKSINMVLQLISVFFIALTVIVYVTLPQMLDLQGVSIVHSITGLAVVYVALGVVNLSGYIDSSMQCHFMAYLIYISGLYAFFWLNVLCFHIWRQVINPSFLKNIKNWKTIYHTYGIGGPLICFFILAIIHHTDRPYFKSIHPGIAEGKCWFKSLRVTMIYFYGPISILLTINMVYFVSTALTLWKRSKTCSKTKILRYRLRLYIKLFFIMGITWIFEIISAAMTNYKGAIKWIWLVTDALNGLVGLIIFLILVVFRKRVVRLLASRKYFSKYRFPESWRQAYDSECDQLEEEINLSI